jgi:hypothetical protein
MSPVLPAPGVVVRSARPRQQRPGDEPLSPIVDGERFVGIVGLVVRAGPRIRIAQLGKSGGPSGKAVS